MSLPWTQLIHEKLAVIATFAYAQSPLEADIEKHFIGQWKFLHKITYERPRAQAIQAVIDFALYFRTLDDEQDMTGFWKQTGMPTVGTLVLNDGSTQSLPPREMTNKIIHAEKIEWDFSEQPKIVCTGRDKEQWQHAIIEVRRLLWVGSQIGS